MNLFIDLRLEGKHLGIRRSIAVNTERVTRYDCFKGVQEGADAVQKMIGREAERAYIELKRKANEMKLFVFDTETGGLDPTTYSLLTLGGVVWEDGKIVDQIDLMICEPILCTTPDAMRVNKIDLADLRKNGLTLNEATQKLNAFLKKHWGLDPVPLVGHNVPFDVGFLKRLYREDARRNTLDGQTFSEPGTYEAARDRVDAQVEKAFDRRFSYRLMDTVGIAQFLNLAGVVPTTNQKLGTLIDALKIERDAGEQHNALADATYTAKVLTRMIESVREKAGMGTEAH